MKFRLYSLCIVAVIGLAACQSDGMLGTTGASTAPESTRGTAEPAASVGSALAAPAAAGTRCIASTASPPAAALDPVATEASPRRPSLLLGGSSAKLADLQRGLGRRMWGPAVLRTRLTAVLPEKDRLFEAALSRPASGC